ncbi:sulfite exporter TauE/SafE family protein [Sphingobacterium bovistauri]|uniref:Probable membrane transporter protein n=1 Tax=Sphingobacterium bovistauri TaxID=2781959 RepID=A0ABS7Z3B1_9SPHI|nr:sulfite exporter TauE/SafE family protein [Sphingobacterium bovistauri]MCA5004673.1 sulfite exporter TauE/SafE family protein [Sphingobacterium bovistauri]
MFITGLLLAVFVGVTLGLVGSGGSILTVPIFVYVFGIEPVLATAYSLFAIGVTSMVGGVKGIINKDVDFDKLLKFGIPSMISVFLTRKFIVPLIPDEIIVFNIVIAQETVLMVLFAIIMLFAAYAMFKEIIIPKTEFPLTAILLKGVFVGSVTGIVGAGGGFLIIPALTNFFNLSMKRAVATSLVLISINSILGLLGDWRRIDLFDWNLLITYTGMTVVGIFIGFYLSGKIDGKSLKRLFSVGIMAVAIFVLLKEFGII